MSLKRTRSPGSALRRLGFKQTLGGALIVGLLVGAMTGIQGAGYNATYPDAKARAQFAASLRSAPSLGVLYGESKNLVSASGYIVYRVVPFMSLIISVWGIVVVTKLLRGQEEDGRWELVTSANTSKRRAAWNVLAGFGGSFGLAYGIGTLITAAAGAAPDVGLTLGTSALLTLAMFLPAAVFISVGLFTSQLSFTRRRALLYGLIPLLTFFALRSLGNTIDDVYWLKYFTPFGWTDLVSPVINPQPIWLLPSLLTAPLFIALGMFLIGKRDLGAGLLKESTAATPRYFLLGSASTFAIRQSAASFIAWGIAALFMSGITGAISTIAADSLANSPTAQNVIANLGGTSDDLKVAVMGTGLVFIVIILLLMATTSMAAIRGAEAKNYLDNLLVQPIRRAEWLTARLLIIAASTLLIATISILTTWYIAGSQGIQLDLGNLLLVGLALTGTVVFTLGFGTFLYGLLPRVAVIGMYAVIGWSFIIDAIGSVTKLDDSVVKSSLFHYLSTSPSKAPDWTTFAWLVGLGLAMATIGIAAFTKRDIQGE